MPLSFNDETDFDWRVEKICVIGPGIVGMPMAALLAKVEICERSEQPASVVVVQRDSITSGWKVPAINAGQSVIGGIEPDLDSIISDAVAAGLLSASHDYSTTSDADMILVCVQTDKDGLAPDYGPLFSCLDNLAEALTKKPPENIPLIVIESTLAPSTMNTLIREHFERYNLVEGKDILLGNSPNRVMPGRLLERIAASDKLVAGLHPLTPLLIERVYEKIVTEAQLFKTNSMTAELVKTLENAYRDVRIAFATEVVRYCDRNDIDFFALRDEVNRKVTQSDEASGDATAVPSGAILVPTVGVGGHCLPKDGILLWWRKIEAGFDTSNSLIIHSRTINDESPLHAINLAESVFGALSGKRIALLGLAYRFDSEDTRNSPTFDLANLLLDSGSRIAIHDPYVKPTDQNLAKHDLQGYFTNSLSAALSDADVVIICTGHRVYLSGLAEILLCGSKLIGLFDGANVYKSNQFDGKGVEYAGIGRGKMKPSEELVHFVEDSFRVVEHGVANEVEDLAKFLNSIYAPTEFNHIEMDDVRHLAGSCVTGCVITQSKRPLTAPVFDGFTSQLALCAERASNG